MWGEASNCFFRFASVKCSLYSRVAAIQGWLPFKGGCYSIYLEWIGEASLGDVPHCNPFMDLSEFLVVLKKDKCICVTRKIKGNERIIHRKCWQQFCVLNVLFCVLCVVFVITNVLCCVVCCAVLCLWSNVFCFRFQLTWKNQRRFVVTLIIIGTPLI